VHRRNRVPWLVFRKSLCLCKSGICVITGLRLYKGRLRIEWLVVGPFDQHFRVSYVRPAVWVLVRDRYCKVPVASFSVVWSLFEGYETSSEMPQIADIGNRVVWHLPTFSSTWVNNRPRPRPELSWARMPAGARTVFFFSKLLRPDLRPSQPPIKWGKVAGAWYWPLASIQCRFEQWVDLYICSPYVPSWRGPFSFLRLIWNTSCFVWWNAEVRNLTAGGI